VRFEDLNTYNIQLACYLYDWVLVCDLLVQQVSNACKCITLCNICMRHWGLSYFMFSIYRSYNTLKYEPWVNPSSICLYCHVIRKTLQFPISNKDSIIRWELLFYNRKNLMRNCHSILLSLQNMSEFIMDTLYYDITLLCHQLITD
jgi:hypothetical protein